VRNKSKVQLYQDLLWETVRNTVPLQVLQDAANEAVKELSREKKKLWESNKRLTAIALESENDRAELEAMLYKAAALVAPHIGGCPNTEEIQTWLSELRTWVKKESAC
jgi:hypothetical protein